MTLPKLPPRAAESNKGDYGRILLIGGSRGMTGAISMSAKAALRSGAGLVRAAVPKSCVETVAGFEPSYMTLGVAEDDNGMMTTHAIDALVEAVKEATVVGCGPGFGRSEEAVDLVARLYAGIEKPMIVDADALFALAIRPLAAGAPAGPRILTPHPGEFKRLAKIETDMSRDQMEAEARRLAIFMQAVIVLKGHRTLITDGVQAAHNDTGNPGMATGGSGDVLTGVVTALVGQGLSVFDAAQLGVHVHGLAGDLAAADLGQVSLIASDLIDYLPRAFRSL
ncbi:MAG TPA: NAD(P)H-hydrate dehydratase [Pirellulales bacterium]|nr:NAD(P)H-hydrate dehydratase [Pirellulales bacterium]